MSQGGAPAAVLHTGPPVAPAGSGVGLETKSGPPVKVTVGLLVDKVPLGGVVGADKALTTVRLTSKMLDSIKIGRRMTDPQIVLWMPLPGHT